MNSIQIQMVLSNFQKALLAEEKQGFTNTGVLGGFNLFLSGILPRLEQLFPGRDLELLQKLAQSYPTWTPLRRRESFFELRRFIQEILLEEQGIPQAAVKPVNIGLQSEQRSKSTPGNKAEIKACHRESAEEEKPLFPDKIRLNPEGGSKHTPPLRVRPLQYLKGIGPERARQLEQLGIHNLHDLLSYYPRRYEDRRKRRIEELKDGETATVEGKIVAGNVTHGKLKVVKLSIEQQGRLVQATWFNQTFILKQYPVGTEVLVTGKVRFQQRIPEILAADIEKVKPGVPPKDAEQMLDTILPVYSETARLSTKVIRSVMHSIVDRVEEEFPEFLPLEELQAWMERSQAHREIHFPTDYTRLTLARNRIVWDEVLFLQLAVAGLRQGLTRQGSPELSGGGDLLNRFYQALPFELTSAQQRVIQEISQDLARTQGMARLVQGDVGSGKTAVAMAALLRTVGSGYQGAMMAPTEILALQHWQSIEKVFTPLGISVVCLLGSQSKSIREGILADIADGQAQVVVGTHALIQEAVVFKKLGLAITDEQHRFGVRQRTLLQSKGESPHVLVLTATPIPRTLALTLYGDLQLSILDEMPVGRKPIITRKLSEQMRPKLEKFLNEQINLGLQVYVVCPLVDESESLDLISATQRSENLQGRFPERRVALLHGKMKGAEKEAIMAAFHAGEIDILVATTVVEVGVNVPKASVMVIESAERFGLAQLHQLRGRVGRGSEQSYCFLMAGTNSRRLDVLCQTEDGFKIAEEDMRLRGTGEILGTRQHGLAELRLADLSQDGILVEKAYQMAQKALKTPQKYEALFQEVQRLFPPEKIGVH